MTIYVATMVGRCAGFVVFVGHGRAGCGSQLTAGRTNRAATDGRSSRQNMAVDRGPWPSTRCRVVDGRTPVCWPRSDPFKGTKKRTAVKIPLTFWPIFRSILSELRTGPQLILAETATIINIAQQQRFRKYISLFPQATRSLFLNRTRI